MEHFVRMLEYIPFVGMATGHNQLGSTPLVTRLLEAAIIGSVVMYGTVRVIGTDIEYIKTEITAIKAEQMQVRRDLYRPVR